MKKLALVAAFKTAEFCHALANALRRLALPLLLLACVSASTCFLTGCAVLAGTQKAIEAYEATKADVEKASAELEKLTKELTDVKTQYDAAVKAGDTTKAGALLQTGQQLLAQWEQAKAAFEASKSAFQNAVKRVQDSKDAESYIGNIFGVVLGAIGGIAGGFGTWGKALGNLANAVKKTAGNVDSYVPEDKWDAFTKAQRDTMTPAEKAAFNKAAAL